MIDALQTWLIGVTVTAFLLAIAETLVSQEGVKRVLHIAGGVLLIIVMIRPLLGVSLEEVGFSIAAYERDVESLTENFTAQQQEDLSAIIEDEVAAYIWDKTQSMGLTCEVTVEMKEGEEGVPLPDTVALSVPYHEELSAWLEEEMGIPPERQVWQEE